MFRICCLSLGLRNRTILSTVVSNQTHWPQANLLTGDYLRWYLGLSLLQSDRLFSTTVRQKLEVVLSLFSQQMDAMIMQARTASPNECCGLLGGIDGRARSTYPLLNVAANPRIAYEAAPEDLFAAQRQMRERGEELLAIYHSHPNQAEPRPSETDVRLAYYPQATYLIIGLAGPEPRLGAFRIFSDEGRWERVEYAIEVAADNRN